MPFDKKAYMKKWYEDRPEYNRKYRETHREELKAYNKKYHGEHPEKSKAYGKKYQETHKPEKKAYSKKYYEEHREENQEKQREYSKKYYEDHREECKARMKKYQEKHKSEISTRKKSVRKKRKETVLENAECRICGDKNINHLIFHHMDQSDKVERVSNMYLPEEIEKEIEKCEILCGNCHNKVHWGSYEYKNKTPALRFAHDYKCEVGCSVCGEKTGCCLQYHHLNPDEKRGNMGKMTHMEDMKKEMAKCIILCNNCHRDYHYEERRAR